MTKKVLIRRKTKQNKTKLPTNPVWPINAIYKMPTAFSRILTRVAVSILYEDNHYITSASIDANSLFKLSFQGCCHLFKYKFVNSSLCVGNF